MLSLLLTLSGVLIGQGAAVLLSGGSWDVRVTIGCLIAAMFVQMYLKIMDGKIMLDKF